MDHFVGKAPGHVGLELLPACVGIYVGEGRVTFVVLEFCLLWIINDLVYGSILVTV